MEKSMNFIKNITLSFVFFTLLSSMAVLSNENNELERLKRSSAKFGYKHSYVPGVITGLAVTKFFKARPLHRLAAFGITSIAGTIFYQTVSEKHLGKRLSCLEWTNVQEPTFKSMLGTLKNGTREAYTKFKNLFE
jgi:hypothetical protein